MRLTHKLYAFYFLTLAAVLFIFVAALWRDAERRPQRFEGVSTTTTEGGRG